MIPSALDSFQSKKHMLLKRKSLAFSRAGVISLLHHLIAERPWTNYLAFLSPFLHFEITVLILTNSTVRASLLAQMVKNLPAIQETCILSLGQEHPLEKEMATHSSIFAWRIPWTKELGGLQSMGSQRVRYN